MTRRRTWVSAVVLTVAAGVIGVAIWRQPAAEQERPFLMPEFESVDPSVPEAKLLGDVLYVNAWREYGRPAGFFYVPKSRPPGLTSLGLGNPPSYTGGSPGGTGDGTRTDAYSFDLGGFRVQAFAVFAARRTDLCEDTKGLTHAVCVRDGAIHHATPTDADFRHLTVYFTGSSDAALNTSEAKKAKRFWADVEMVPVREAGWFTDLITRAKAAVPR